MKSRPLIQKGIAELEMIFSEADRDLAVLRQLKEELKHRKMARAFTLLKKVEATLAVSEQQSGTESEPKKVTVAASVQEVTSPSHSKALGQRGREIKPVADLFPTLTDRGKERESDVGSEWVGVWSTQQSPISLTLEESYGVLGVVSSSSWELIELARRTLVERSRPDLIAELSEGQRERVQADAYRANQAHAVLMIFQMKARKL